MWQTYWPKKIFTALIILHFISFLWTNFVNLREDYDFRQISKYKHVGIKKHSMTFNL